MKISATSTVLVLGAGGRLGRQAAQAFAARGWRVLALSRRPLQAWPALLADRIVTVQGDALAGAALLSQQPELAQIDVIVHALNPHYARWATELPPLTEAVLALARATGATVMLPGNVYNFGRHLPSVLREDTPFVPDTPKAEQRIALEAALAAAAPTVRSIVIRAGDFLAPAGEGTETWLALGLGRRLKAGVFSPMGPPDILHAWAWLPDLAEVFARVAERRAALPAFSVWHYEGLSLSAEQWQQGLEAHLGQDLRTRPFAWWPLKVLALGSPLIRALVAMRYLWERPHRLEGRRLAELLGADLPRTPLQRVLAQAL
ncbi:NAD-dependent epimerase/dehydratase family protein [Leptothrix ochracea]|uniref:NAD-dependent epimerase/dehydratase family protein n=1 Tax=Leptothrix ochracea TaxID=735331 RepID=UPI0034E2A22D